MPSPIISGQMYLDHTSSHIVIVLGIDTVIMNDYPVSLVRYKSIHVFAECVMSESEFKNDYPTLIQFPYGSIEFE